MRQQQDEGVPLEFFLVCSPTVSYRPTFMELPRKDSAQTPEKEVVVERYHTTWTNK